jgi:trans-aconitate 2-methyltransferase
MVGGTPPWDPAQYLRFGDERARPFLDLVDRIGVTDVRRVVDLGCGPGTLTAGLCDRWPAATVVGVDTSVEMITAARRLGHDRLRFVEGDLRTWRTDGPVDVVVANAVLQWVPAHDTLLVDLMASVCPGGAFAFQVPGNFDAPSHRCIEDTVTSARWRAHIGAEVLDRPRSFDAEHYLGVLTAAGYEVDAWETTYLHVLRGERPVLEWVRGTALRPVLAALDPAAHEAFCDDLAGRLAIAYPSRDGRTVLPFRRIFVIARSATG